MTDKDRILLLVTGEFSRFIREFNALKRSNIIKNVYLVAWEEAAVSLATYTSRGKGAARHRHSNCRGGGSHGASRTPDRCWDTWAGRVLKLGESD